MKCARAECSEEAKKGLMYCSECWKKMCERTDEEERNEDQNVPEENTGNFPW